MIRILHIATIVAATVALAQIARGELITGAIGFTGGVTYDTASAGTATAVTSWINPVATLRSGSFLSVAFATPANFTPAIWDFNTTTPVTNFWSVGGFTFDLLSSTNYAQGGTTFSGPNANGFIVADGSGTVRGNGFAPTGFTWAFVSQDPKSGSNPDAWTFSASASTAIIQIRQMGTNVLVYGAGPPFVFQAAPTANGPFTNIPDATFSYTNTSTDQPRFFRLKG
jgi:hypothetical protein